MFFETPVKYRNDRSETLQYIIVFGHVSSQDAPEMHQNQHKFYLRWHFASTVTNVCLLSLYVRLHVIPNGINKTTKLMAPSMTPTPSRYFKFCQILHCRM